MSEEQAVSKPRSRRIYVYWAVALGLVALLGVAVLLFGPPVVWYNVYVLKSRPTDRNSIARFDSDAVKVCTDAACKGNRLAMSAIMDHYPCFALSESYAKMAIARPDDFVGHFRGRTDEWLTEGLFYAATGLQYENPKAAAKIISYPGCHEPALALARLRESKRPEVAKAAEALLNFTERRYPGTLKEAKALEAKGEF